MENEDPKPETKPAGDLPPPRPPHRTILGLGPDDDDSRKKPGTPRIQLPTKPTASPTIKLPATPSGSTTLTDNPRPTGHRKLYRRLFIAASALAAIGFFCLPLELDIYLPPGGPLDWMWNGTPPVSTETANYWHTYSLWPLWMFALLTAIVSLILSKRKNRRGLS